MSWNKEEMKLKCMGCKQAGKAGRFQEGGGIVMATYVLLFLV